MFMLRELRKAKGITMKELGEMVGVAESTISQYETEKREPDFETLLKFGEIFDVSVDFLLRGNIYTGEQPQKSDSSSGIIDDAAAEFGRQLFAAHGDIAPEDYTQEDIDDVAMFLKIKRKRLPKDE
ncbi:helix-turn-helix transcriptional regulator [Clostridia bacterium OttesenSCG-928-O13]|nr:helix-turn-helix transcriptional regulator [Clostridia bacterium OttesenSCG-928-O13]